MTLQLLTLQEKQIEAGLTPYLELRIAHHSGSALKQNIKPLFLMEWMSRVNEDLDCQNNQSFVPNGMKDLSEQRLKFSK